MIVQHSVLQQPFLPEGVPPKKISYPKEPKRTAKFTGQKELIAESAFQLTDKLV
jgi:hypothetical protein